MRDIFPLFSSPIQLAHMLWEKLLGKDDMVIDATMGNGKDTLKLAQILSNCGSGRVIALDIQPKALENTLSLLRENIPEFLQNIELLLTSHENFPSQILPGSVKLIVYNLGYLPGADKELTTQTGTTLLSIENALKLIAPGGALSITCYPGHAEGQKEHEAIKAFVKDRDLREYCVSEHTWPSRNLSPILLLIQKSN
ncbi:MAG: class I SAM-dependent methyltransferase [Chlamydiae bacterium]|nr:class I SAM-dependent methyltransferase [Chlamydiota bacterium]